MPLQIAHVKNKLTLFFNNLPESKMTKEQLAEQIARQYKYVDPITTKEVEKILSKIRFIQDKNNGQISEEDAEKAIYEVLDGRTVFSLSSIDTSDTANLLQQIIAAAKNNAKPNS